MNHFALQGSPFSVARPGIESTSRRGRLCSVERRTCRVRPDSSHNPAISIPDRQGIFQYDSPGAPSVLRESPAHHPFNPIPRHFVISPSSRRGQCAGRRDSAVDHTDVHNHLHGVAKVDRIVESFCAVQDERPVRGFKRCHRPRPPPRRCRCRRSRFDQLLPFGQGRTFIASCRSRQEKTEREDRDRRKFNAFFIVPPLIVRNRSHCIPVLQPMEAKEQRLNSVRGAGSLRRKPEGA